MKAVVLGLLVAVAAQFSVSNAHADAAFSTEINFQVEQVKMFAKDLSQSSRPAKMINLRYGMLSESVNGLFDQIAAGADASDYEKDLVRQSMDALSQLYTRYALTR